VAFYDGLRSFLVVDGGLVRRGRKLRIPRRSRKSIRAHFRSCLTPRLPRRTSRLRGRFDDHDQALETGLQTAPAVTRFLIFPAFLPLRARRSSRSAEKLPTPEVGPAGVRANAARDGHPSRLLMNALAERYERPPTSASRSSPFHPKTARHAGLRPSDPETTDWRSEVRLSPPCGGVWILPEGDSMNSQARRLMAGGPEPRRPPGAGTGYSSRTQQSERSTSGTSVRGTVTWDGDPPIPRPIRVRRTQSGDPRRIWLLCRSLLRGRPGASTG